MWKLLRRQGLEKSRTADAVDVPLNPRDDKGPNNFQRWHTGMTQCLACGEPEQEDPTRSDECGQPIRSCHQLLPPSVEHVGRQRDGAWAARRVDVRYSCECDLSCFSNLCPNCYMPSRQPLEDGHQPTQSTEESHTESVALLAESRISAGVDIRCSPSTRWSHGSC